MTQATPNIPTSNKQSQEVLRVGTMHWYHWLVVSLSIVLTLGAWYISKEQLAQKVEERFLRESDRVVALVKERMELYENALWGSVALYDASDNVSYDEWMTYSNSLHLDKTYPGINGIGVIYNVQPSDLEDYLARERGWRPEYKIHPQHSEPEYWPITYIEPAESNRKAIGLDMAFETNRYTAIKKARDTGEAQVTGPIVLVQDAKKTPGFLFYTPFYKNSRKPQTVEERREHIEGVIYAPFITYKLLQGTLAQSNRHVSLAIRDGDEILYDEHTGDSDIATDPNPLFKRKITMRMYGRTWVFDVWSNLSFRNTSSSAQPYMILIGGVVIDALLFGLFFFIARSNRLAIKYADKKTVELRARTEELEWSYSELAESQAQLSLSENRFELATRGTSDGLWDWNIVTDEIWYAQRYKTLLGFKEVEFPNVFSSFTSRLHPEDEADVLEVFRQHRAEDQSIDIDCRMEHKDGEYRWFRVRGVTEHDDKGKPVRMAGSIQDITDRKQAEQSLRDSAETIRAVLENAADAIITIDAHGGIETVNPAAERMFGYAALDIIGRDLDHLMPPQHQPEQDGYIQSCLKTGNAWALRVGRDVVGLHKDGMRIPLELSISEMVIDQKQKCTVIARDMTEHKEAEAKILELNASLESKVWERTAQLEKAQKELVKQARYAGMADIAAGILHNIGNVLNSTNVSATVVSDKINRLEVDSVAKLAKLFEDHGDDLASYLTQDPTGMKVTGFLATVAKQLTQSRDDLQKEIESVRNNVEHIRMIVVSQQKHARYRGVHEEIDVKDMLDDALKMAIESYDQNEIQVIKQFEDFPPVYLDRHKLLQVLLNLFQNARHALRDSDQQDMRLDISLEKVNDHRIRITVSDNGMGIPQESLPRLFESGYTTKPEGTGFGLHSAANAAKEMGGSLTAHSDGPGRGATFVLEIAITKDQKEAAA